MLGTHQLPIFQTTLKTHRRIYLTTNKKLMPFVEKLNLFVPLYCIITRVVQAEK